MAVFLFAGKEVISTRNRQNRVEIRLNDNEDIKLHNLMRETGFNASQLIRSLILHTDIKTRPPDEYPKLIRELSAIGNNVNQIARKANSTDTVDTTEVIKMRRAFESLSEEVRNL